MTHNQDLKTGICFPEIFSGKNKQKKRLYNLFSQCIFHNIICSKMYSFLYCFSVPFFLPWISIILFWILCFWQLQLWDLSHPSLDSFVFFLALGYFTSSSSPSLCLTIYPLLFLFALQHPFIRQRACHTDSLQWSASIPQFSNRLTGTFWLSNNLYANFRSPTNWWEHELNCNPDSSTPFFYWKCFSLDFILSNVECALSALSTPDDAEWGGDCRRGNGQHSDK